MLAAVLLCVYIVEIKIVIFKHIVRKVKIRNTYKLLLENIVG